MSNAWSVAVRRETTEDSPGGAEPQAIIGSAARRSFGDRGADAIASFGGSWTFIIWFLVSMGVWMAYNALSTRHQAFDPYPFILLNLVLSTLAAIQAPIIMMSQKRQEQRQRASDQRHQAADRALARQISARTGHTEEMVEAALGLLRGEIERKLDDVVFRLDAVLERGAAEMENGGRTAAREVTLPGRG